MPTLLPRICSSQSSSVIKRPYRTIEKTGVIVASLTRVVTTGSRREARADTEGSQVSASVRLAASQSIALLRPRVLELSDEGRAPRVFEAQVRVRHLQDTAPPDVDRPCIERHGDVAHFGIERWLP